MELAGKRVTELSMGGSEH